MATATTSFGLSKPSTSFILPPKSLNSFSTTLKFRTPFRPTRACSITNRLTDSSKPLNAATATSTSSSTSTIRKTTTQGTLCANYAVQEATGKLSFSEGKEELMEQLKKRPEALGDAIPPENGIVMLSEMPRCEIITLGERMWDAQWYGFESPPQWPSSSGLGAMGSVSPPPKHQMWAAQGHGFKVQSVQCTSSGLGTVRNTVCSDDQCEIFAAEGYDRVSGKPGICIATSRPGATNLASGLADALPDNVSSVSITGQVPRCSATHQQQPVVPTWEPHLDSNLDQILPAIFESKKPVLYVGGGCLNSSAELGRFVQLTGIPVASTLKGLGTYPLNYPLSLGMHGTLYANYAIQEADLLLAFGVRFDDRVTGKLEEFAGRAKIVHIDIDPAETGKNKQPHISVCADLENSLDKMNKLLEERIDSIGKLDFSAWIEELMEQKKKCTLWFNMFGKAIPKEYERKVLDELIIVGVITAIKERQHQMRASQEYGFKGPRQWATSCGNVPVPAAKDIMWAPQWYGLKAQVVELCTSSGIGEMGLGLIAAKHQSSAAQWYGLKAQVFKLGTSSGLGAMGFGLRASEHQMWAAQGYGFKGQFVELCTSSGLEAMGVGLHAAKHQMWAAQGYRFNTQLVQLGTSSGIVPVPASKDIMWAAQMYGFEAQVVELCTSSGVGAMGLGLLAAKHQTSAAQWHGLRAQVVELGTSSGLGAMGFGLRASKHQMCAAQGYGFKDHFVELCTSSGLGAMGFGLHAAKHQMWAAQGYTFNAQLVELGNSSGLGAMGVGLFATKVEMWAAQMYGFKGPRQFATSSGLGAVAFGLPAAIVVCVVQKKGNPFLWIKKNKGVKLGIIFLEIVELLQFIRKKLGIIFPQIVQLFQTGP